MITNYSRSIAVIALHFNRLPHDLSVDDINSYLYRMTVHEKRSATYFKHVVYGLRHWFRLFGMEAKAIAMPSIKHAIKKVQLGVEQAVCLYLFKYASESFITAILYGL